ncbi:hypothetical protein KR084_004496 [Drosophila pseudotakahashii]|nr:hypothetical protein KR084_004496 [Drosophila pseudotakahashii]
MVFMMILSFGLMLCVWPQLVLSRKSSLDFVTFGKCLQFNYHTESSCVIPNGAVGNCVKYEECPFVQKIIGFFGDNIPLYIRTQFSQMQCKTNVNTKEIHICCPYESTTQFSIKDDSKSKVVRSESKNLNRYDRRGLKLLNSVTNCGIRRPPSLTVGAGGMTAKPGDYPWVALLKYKINDLRPFLCGGSLISERHILTAAHCIISQPEVVAVRLGEHDLETEKDCYYLISIKPICLPLIEEYGIEKIRVHTNYVHGQIGYDIAIIQLDRVVDQKWNINPVCLPIDKQSQELDFNQAFLIVGWGATENVTFPSQLQEVQVSRTDLDECRRYYKKDEVNDNHICATGTGIKQTCRGDSGGPLFIEHRFKNMYRQVQYGVISFGGNYCGQQQNQPGIFASVIDMLPWITQNLQ